MAAVSPMGIEGLAGLHRVTIRQKVSGFSNNKYAVLTPDGAVILYAKEDSGALNRLFGGKDRAFEINIFDTQHREVVRLRRPYTFGPDKMDVVLRGSLVSVVRQEVTFFKTVLNINDAHDRPMYRVKGPLSTTGDADFKVSHKTGGYFNPVSDINDADYRPMLRVKGLISTVGDADFKLYNTNKQQVGVIGKRWGGMALEMFSNADHFEITFPPDASVSIKAAIIGTCFLIDFLHYEN